MVRHPDGSLQRSLPTPNPYAEVCTADNDYVKIAAVNGPVDNSTKSAAGCTQEMDQAGAALPRCQNQSAKPQPRYGTAEHMRLVLCPSDSFTSVHTRSIR